MQPEDLLVLSKGLPNNELCVIPRAGHMANLEQPDVFNDCLLSFLAGSVRRTRPELNLKYAIPGFLLLSFKDLNSMETTTNNTSNKYHRPAWMRVCDILLRTGHVGFAGILLGGFIFEVPFSISISGIP